MFPFSALSPRWLLPGVERHHAGAVALAAVVVTAGCGSAPGSPPVNPGPIASAPESPGAEAPAASAGSVAPSAAPGEGPASSDGFNTIKGKAPTSLTPLFEKGAPPVFPVATTSEQACWRSVGVVGNARQDYEMLTTKCGASTGAVQYVTPAIGHLHHKHQRRDTFTVPIQGGLCYRFFGVGDSTINDLDILIEQRGSLVGDDKTVGPVAIIESDKAWCMDRDGVYDFLVQVHGEGHGQYVFGIWARKDTR